MKKNNQWRKCCGCGKYLSFEDMDNNAVYDFTPDTHFTVEKIEWYHKECANG